MFDNIAGADMHAITGSFRLTVAKAYFTISYLYLGERSSSAKVGTLSDRKLVK